MAITVRTAGPKDLEDMLRIEKETMPGHTYLYETQKELLDPAQGWMLLALDGEKPIGIAHLYRQPDDEGWFEILRVTPAEQKKGAGTALWDRALELCAENGLKGIAMYTGLTNVTSRKIAERKGLDLRLAVKEGSLTREDAEKNAAGASRAGSCGFEKITDTAEAAGLCEKYGCEQAFGGKFVYNRTFFAFSPENISWLAGEGMLYAADGCLLSAGARFNKDAAFQIGFVGGNEEKALAYAEKLLLEGPWPKLVIDIPEGRADLREKLEARGYKFLDSPIITLKRDL